MTHLPFEEACKEILSIGVTSSKVCFFFGS
jgi:hypothetical protein